MAPTLTSRRSLSLTATRSRDGITLSLGKHALKLGGEFQHYTAHGIINPFGNGTIILVSDFGFADLNGDGVINDLDIPVAVAIHSTGPVVPVPIPQVGDSATRRSMRRTTGAPAQI
jgi:hypothetical protein